MRAATLKEPNMLEDNTHIHIQKTTLRLVVHLKKLSTKDEHWDYLPCVPLPRPSPEQPWQVPGKPEQLGITTSEGVGVDLENGIPW